jgi:2-polyprenyl-6-methoxyphenol hydroxylase-like FAD-dependent oxidoreductase
MELETQVAIVGAGPVGLTIAMDLALRGVRVVVIEQRAEDEPADAKCNSVGARTMEIFRRLGVADAVRAAGLGDDFSTDVIFTTAISGEELSRIPLPSRNQRFGPDGRSAPGYVDSHWLTPEPVVRVSQYYLNPILQSYAREMANVTLRSETCMESFEDTGDSVIVRAERRDGTPLTVRARYLIGCDGGTSRVRKQMGVDLLGDTQIARTRSTLIRSADLMHLFPGQPAWMSWILNPRITGVVVAIDGDELWLVHRNLSDHMTSYEDLDFDQSIRDVLGVERDFRWETIRHQDWTGRRLVAARFRQGNTFIAGDAAHLWIPYAGYGMNAGIADGANLAWMMAAVLNGHADEALLSAHEAERHPITEQVSRLAMNKAVEHLGKVTNKQILAAVEDEGPAGRRIREELGRQLHEINAPQFACAGLNFGYFYDRSPIIRYDGDRPPPYDMASAEPSTVPGCRVPHFWIDDKVSLYDALGDYYTLLRFDDAQADDGDDGMDAFAAACEHLKLPLKVLAVSSDADYFTHRFLVVRSDQHIAWRGNAFPKPAERLVRQLRGEPETK